MATFALSIAKGMPTLVKYICCMILMVCALGWAKPQEEKATPYEAMPYETHTECIQAQESTIAKTIAHLSNEQTGIPVQAATKGPMTSTYSFKPKCLSTSIGNHRPDTHNNETYNIFHLPLRYHFHAIDYYIYTLEHILI